MLGIVATYGIPDEGDGDQALTTPERGVRLEEPSRKLTQLLDTEDDHGADLHYDRPRDDSDHCPAVFVEEETGDLLFQGWTITDPATLAEVSQRSPVADNESVVRLPARMREIILEALSRHGATVQRVDRRDQQLSGSPRDAGRVHT